MYNKEKTYYRIDIHASYSLFHFLAQFSFFLFLAILREVEAFLEAENDVILICTSILSFSKLLKSMPLHCLKRPTLFVDVLSVKEHPRDILLQVLNLTLVVIR